MIDQERLLKNALEDAMSNRRQKKIDPDDMGQIWGLLNSCDEYVKLTEPIDVTANLENWLTKLEFSMKNSVSSNLLDCFKMSSYS